MTESVSNDRHGVMTEAATLQLQRLLPGPIERIWAYLTDSDLRAQWLARGTMPAQAGAEFEFVWRNDELSKPSGQRPAMFPEEHRMRSRLITIDPPRKLVFSWQETGEVCIELEPRGTMVLLTVTHRRLSGREGMLMVSAGWHMHLDILIARLEGREPAAFWDGWLRLKDEYDRRLPA